MPLALVIIPFLLLHVSLAAYDSFYLQPKSHETPKALNDNESSVNQSQFSQRQSNIGIIDLEGGKIRGEETKLGFSYRGIPYAEPPVGDLRFANPKKYSQTWNNIRDYSKFGPKCAQFDHFSSEFEGSEDCLTINVFVPMKTMKGGSLAPVVFFIHGGASMYGGSKDYGSQNFIDDQRMILVTANYRVGILGFFSTGDLVIPGNFGLKDQVEALRWVKRNIVAFKGDPNSVTLAGFSAGAAHVHLHYMSPLTTGLFAKGISHSGNALDPWVMQEKASEKATDTELRFGCLKNNDPNWLLTCLRGVPVEPLVMFTSYFQRFMYNPFAPFGVVVELQSDTAYLTDHPKRLLELGRFKDMPWILSQTSDEGLYPAAEFVDKKILTSIDIKWMDIAPYLLDFVTDPIDQLEWSENVRKEYFKNETIDMRRFFQLRQVTNQSSDEEPKLKASFCRCSLTDSSIAEPTTRSSTTQITNVQTNISTCSGEDHSTFCLLIPFGKTTTHFPSTKMD
jgi:carboxylesterase type B